MMKKYLLELADRLNSENNYFFIFFCAIAIIIAFLTNTLLIGDELYYNFFSDQLSVERVGEIVRATKKWGWVGYILIAVSYFIKFLLISICLTIGLLLSNRSVPFKRLFFIVMTSELIFLIVPILKIIWFGFLQTDYTLIDLQNFSPLSVFSLMDREAIEPWLIYPLQLINLFEAVYWLLLIYGLHIVTQEPYVRMLGLVAVSYGSGLLLWITCVLFASINLMP